MHNVSYTYDTPLPTNEPLLHGPWYKPLTPLRIPGQGPLTLKIDIWGSLEIILPEAQARLSTARYSFNLSKLHV